MACSGLYFFLDISEACLRGCYGMELLLWEGFSYLGKLALGCEACWCPDVKVFVSRERDKGHRI